MQLHTPRDFGGLIRARRLAMHISQNELAKKVGVSRLWIIQTERGNPGASLDLILRTITELGVILTAPEGGVTTDMSMSDKPPLAQGPDIGAILEAARRP